jgi:hypothetical protein
VLELIRPSPSFELVVSHATKNRQSGTPFHCTIIPLSVSRTPTPPRPPISSHPPENPSTSIRIQMHTSNTPPHLPHSTSSSSSSPQVSPSSSYSHISPHPHPLQPIHSPILRRIPRLNKRLLRLIRIRLRTDFPDADFRPVLGKHDVFLLELARAALGELVRVDVDLCVLLV